MTNDQIFKNVLILANRAQERGTLTLPEAVAVAETLQKLAAVLGIEEPKPAEAAA